MKRNKIVSLVVVAALVGMFQNCGQTQLSSYNSEGGFSDPRLNVDKLDPFSQNKSVSLLEGESLGMIVGTSATGDSYSRVSSSNRIVEVRNEYGDSRMTFNDSEVMLNSATMNDEGVYQVIFENSEIVELNVDVIPQVRMSAETSTVSVSENQSAEVMIEFTAPSSANFRWTHRSQMGTRELDSSQYEIVRSGSGSNGQMTGHTVLKLDQVSRNDAGSLIFTIASDENTVQQSVDTVVNLDVDYQESIAPPPPPAPAPAPAPVVDEVKEKVANHVQFSNGVDYNKGQMWTRSHAEGRHSGDKARYASEGNNVSFNGSFLIWGSELLASTPGCLHESYLNQYRTYIEGLNASDADRFATNHPACGEGGTSNNGTGGGSSGSDHTATVTAIYLDVLERAPDTPGLNFYVGLLEAGNITVQQIEDDMKTKREYKEIWIKKFYVRYFEREADIPGLNFWTDKAVDEGMSFTEIKGFLRRSSDCKNYCITD